MKHPAEYRKFTNLVGQLLTVSHEEMKRREAGYRKQVDENPNRRGPKRGSKKKRKPSGNYSQRARAGTRLSGTNPDSRQVGSVVLQISYLPRICHGKSPAFMRLVALKQIEALFLYIPESKHEPWVASGSYQNPCPRSSPSGSTAAPPAAPATACLSSVGLSPSPGASSRFDSRPCCFV